MVVAVVQPAVIPSAPIHDDTLVQQIWHSLEEALHIREPMPPPVPPKDERWLVHTVDLSIPQQHEDDIHFWDKLATRLISRYHHRPHLETDQESVSIDLPAEAALSHLGRQSSEGQVKEQRVYFRRMARLCQQKFEHDHEQARDVGLLNGSIDSNHNHRHRHVLSSLQEHLRPGQRRSSSSGNGDSIRSGDYMAVNVDPIEMKAAHRLIYGHRERSASAASLVFSDKCSTPEQSDEDESWGRSMFGLWWSPGRHRDSKTKHSLGEDDWEKVDVPKHKADQKESLREQNGRVTTESESKLQPQSKANRSTLQRHQALAAAAAYEAMKVYQAKRIRQGKKVSHGEMKAVLAGIAMAEAVKLLESKHAHSHDRYGDKNILDNDDTVAEAGTKVLKLFELWRSPTQI